MKGLRKIEDSALPPHSPIPLSSSHKELVVVSDLLLTTGVNEQRKQEDEEAAEIDFSRESSYEKGPPLANVTVGNTQIESESEDIHAIETIDLHFPAQPHKNEEPSLSTTTTRQRRKTPKQQQSTNSHNTQTKTKTKISQRQKIADFDLKTHGMQFSVRNEFENDNEDSEEFDFENDNNNEEENEDFLSGEEEEQVESGLAFHNKNNKKKSQKNRFLSASSSSSYSVVDNASEVITPSSPSSSTPITTMPITVRQIGNFAINFLAAEIEIRNLTEKEAYGWVDRGWDLD
jgi:hypothetical protein